MLEFFNNGLMSTDNLLKLAVWGKIGMGPYFQLGKVE